MLEGVMHKVRVVEELVKARLEVDMAGLVQGARARLESRLALTPLPVSAELADRAGPLGWGRVKTQAWEAPGFRKIVLSHVAVWPAVEGFALVLLPHTKLEAPVFGADLMALPMRVSVNADIYGDGAGGLKTAGVLAPLGESFAQLGSGPGPEWTRVLTAGNGLHAKVSPRAVEGAFAGLTAALAHYLEAAATPSEGPLGAEAQRSFFIAFHEHGPRRGPVAKLFGAPWAERYSRLIFE